MTGLPSLSLSQLRLGTFLACQRQFQLRYVERMPWPIPPQDERWREAGERGQEFHRLLQRHFLGLPVATPGEGDPLLAEWWQRFQQQGPPVPEGQRLVEVTLTVPVGRHLLSGRFDLLVLDAEQTHIFDWKTEKTPPPADRLRRSWQTRLYLALLAEGGAALEARQQSVLPDQIALTYWFAQAPEEPVRIHYSQEWHEENWQEITDLVAQIEQQLEGQGVWPLTDDLTLCARCAYQVLCGREGAPAGAPGEMELEPDPPVDDRLEPDYL